MQLYFDAIHTFFVNFIVTKLYFIIFAASKGCSEVFKQNYSLFTVQKHDNAKISV